MWLLLWTVGGVSALRELVRLLWGSTLVIVAPDRVIVEHRAGPFRSHKEVPRESVQSVRVLRLRHRGTVIVESASGRIDVARTSNLADAERLVAELRRELGLDDPDRAAVVTLPPGWAECLTAEGGVAVAPDPTVRARQARVLGVSTLIVASVTFLSARQWLQGPVGLHEPGLLSLAIVFGTVALGFLAGTVWLARGRNEWRVDRGRIVLQRRFGDDVSERFVATALELTLTNDSDGDEFFTLKALSGPAVGSETSRTLAALNPAFGGDPGAPRTQDPGAPPRQDWSTPHGQAGGAPRRPADRIIVRVMNDASVPRSLGRWLAARGEIPLTDRATAEAQAIDLNELRGRLASSGRLGALVERWVGKLVP